MSTCLEDTVRYVCRKCGWRWSKPVNVKLTLALMEVAIGVRVLSRPISVPEGPCCKEVDE
jgi:hypothetical protein